MAKKPQAKSKQYMSLDEHYAETEVALVRMVRSPSFPAPHTADVHPDEVENYAAGGWEKA